MSSAPARVATGSVSHPPQSNSTGFSVIACALFAVLGIVTTLLGPILPFLTARWSISSAEAGALFSWQFVASTVGTLLSGAALSKSPFKLLVMLGTSLCLVGVATLIGANWMLGRYAVSCYGFGLGVALPAINLAVAEANPGKRAGSVSVLNFSWGVGAISGPVLLRTTRSLMLFLLLTSILLAVGLLIAALSAMPLRRVDATERTFRFPTGQSIWTLAPLLALSMFLYCGVENSIAGWASSLALPSFSNAYAATSANIAFWTFFLLARALAPFALRFVSEAKLLLLSIIVGSAGTILFFACSQPAVILLACGLAGLGVGPGFPLLIARVSEGIGSERPAATICFAFAGFGAATLPTLMGVMGASFPEPRVELAVPFFALLLLLPASRWIAPASRSART